MTEFAQISPSPGRQRARQLRRLAAIEPRIKAFSALEILIAVLIMGILAVLIVPALAKRVKESRIASAQQDLNELREAETRVAIDTGYYYPQHVLDDQATIGVLGTEDTFFAETLNAKVIASRRTMIFIDPKTGDFVNSADAALLYGRITRDERALERFQFRGPYANWNRDRNGDDMQDDPWGNPYMMFTKEGLIWEYDNPDSSAGQIRHQLLTSWSYDTFDATGAFATATKVFDRPVFLSMGPNGMPGGSDPLDLTTYNRFGQGDDIVIYFE